MARQIKMKDLPPMMREVRPLLKVRSVVEPIEIVPRRCALIVLDMNNICAHRDYGFALKVKEIGLPFDYYYDTIDKVVIPNIQRLLEVFRQEGLKVIYTQMGYEKEDMSDVPPTWRRLYPKIGYDQGIKGSKGFEIREEIKPREGDICLIKRSSGAFGGSNIHEVVQDSGVDTLILTGVETDCCLYNTAIEANDRGYHVVVVEDASTTFTQTGHRVFLYGYGAIFFFHVKTTNEVIKELKETLARTPA